jgi:hypothetical protein
VTIDLATTEINLYVSVTIQTLRDDGDAQIEFNRQSINVFVQTTIIALQKDADDYIIRITLEINQAT